MKKEILFRGERVDNGELIKGGYFKTSFGKDQTFIIIDTETGAKFIEVIPETVAYDD